ncbi:hypothetical protein G4B88_012865 [Cannabis sativa]|uniref:Uncharacterized protein n=1 Tax=Cannabis sativa TaxID=3483 RepID=A0A7J6DN62_CANSA|nr:hypothetical protein G4B88_012865 [Cannabis sativa]
MCQFWQVTITPASITAAATSDIPTTTPNSTTSIHGNTVHQDLTNDTLQNLEFPGVINAPDVSNSAATQPPTSVPEPTATTSSNNARDDEECWYKICSKVVRFGVEELLAITGFKCGGQYNLKPLNKKKMLKFKARMFPNFGITDKVTRRDVRDVFLGQEFLIDDDDVIEDDFRLTDAKRHNRLLKNIKFQSVYLPKSLDDENEPDFEDKFENSCRSLSFIKDSQVGICNEMTILRDEFFGDLAKLSEMIEKMNSKNYEKMDTIDLFGASDREAYYQDLSDGVGSLELSVHSVKSAVHEDNVDYSHYYLSPDVMKVVDNTIKDILYSKDQSSCGKNNNMEMVLFDDSYQTPKNPKCIRKESAIVLSPFITDFGSSDSGKDILKNIHTSFADLFINEKIHEIPRNMADKIATYRDDMDIGRHQVEDDVRVRKEKSKTLKEKENAKGKGKEITNFSNDNDT